MKHLCEPSGAVRELLEILHVRCNRGGLLNAGKRGVVLKIQLRIESAAQVEAEVEPVEKWGVGVMPCEPTRSLSVHVE